MSRDDSMLRLTLGPVSKKCQGHAFETQFSKIWVTEDLDHPAFRRQLDDWDFSLVTYIMTQDSFLFGTLTDRIQREHASMRKAACLQELQRGAFQASSLHSSAQPSMGPQLASLGAGWFGVNTGDSFTKLHCHQVDAIAQPSQVSILPCLSTSPSTTKTNIVGFEACLTERKNLFSSSLNHVLTSSQMKGSKYLVVNNSLPRI